MSKEEVIAAVLRCATNLGRVPTREELMTYGEVSRRDLSRNFGTLKRALSECKLERTSGNRKQREATQNPVCELELCAGRTEKICRGEWAGGGMERCVGARP